MSKKFTKEEKEAFVNIVNGFNDVFMNTRRLKKRIKPEFVLKSWLKTILEQKT